MMRWLATLDLSDPAILLAAVGALATAAGATAVAVLKSGAVLVDAFGDMLVPMSEFLDRREARRERRLLLEIELAALRSTHSPAPPAPGQEPGAGGGTRLPAQRQRPVC